MNCDFIMFMQNVILPRQAQNPDHIRLDGQVSGGNRESAGRFQYDQIVWVVHKDTHYEPLCIAYDEAVAGRAPFVAEDTKSGQCLVLKPKLRSKQKNPRYKYLYIYSWK